jgi:hypothetical protein
MQPAGGDMIRVNVLAVIGALGALALGDPPASAAADGSRVGTVIELPARAGLEPPPVTAVVPRTVITPDASVYFYKGSYYTFSNGAWFVAGRYAGPWGRVVGPPPWVIHSRDGHWRQGHLRGPTHD